MKHAWLVCLGVVVLSMVSLEIYLVPILGPFSQPTGPYSPGVMRYMVEDPLRSDTYLSTPRSFMIDLYYPSHSPRGKQFAYHPAKLQALSATLSRDSWVPQAIYIHLVRGITSYAQPEAPTADGPFSVIIFLPGIGAEALYNVYLEELASYGFVVAALEPPYDNLVSVLADGSVRKIDPQLHEAMRKGDRDAIYAYRTRAHAEWLKDIDLVIDFLEQLSEQPQSPGF